MLTSIDVTSDGCLSLTLGDEDAFDLRSRNFGWCLKILTDLGKKRSIRLPSEY